MSTTPSSQQASARLILCVGGLYQRVRFHAPAEAPVYTFTHDANGKLADRVLVAV